MGTIWPDICSWTAAVATHAVIYDLVGQQFNPFHIFNWLLFNSLHLANVSGRRLLTTSSSTTARTKQQMARHLHWSTTDTIFNKLKVIYVTVAGQGYFDWNVIEKRAQPACWWRHSALRTDDGVTRARPIINQSLPVPSSLSIAPTVTMYYCVGLGSGWTAH